MSRKYALHNFRLWQGQPDKRALWLKLYIALLQDPKFCALSHELRGVLLELYLAKALQDQIFWDRFKGSKYHGPTPPAEDFNDIVDLDVAEFHLRLPLPAEALAHLVDAGFISPAESTSPDLGVISGRDGSEITTSSGELGEILAGSSPPRGDEGKREETKGNETSDALARVETESQFEDQDGPGTPREDRRPKGQPSDDAYRLANILLEQIVARDPDAKAGKNPDRTVERWAIDIDRLIRLDGRRPEQVTAVLTWLPSADFWPGVILSADALRKNFEKLLAKYQDRGRATTSTSRATAAPDETYSKAAELSPEQEQAQAASIDAHLAGLFHDPLRQARVAAFLVRSPRSASIDSVQKARRWAEEFRELADMPFDTWQRLEDEEGQATAEGAHG